MTQTGKCDTCRQRKVKCDEERPICGACQKKDRPCTYSYGKISAFVVQDPNQLTKHGKSKATPIIYSLDSSEDCNTLSNSTPSDLQITTQRAAEHGQGFFQTLAQISKPKVRPSKKKAAHQKRTLEIYLQQLQDQSVSMMHQPSSPGSALTARYIGMLGSETFSKQPLSILGTWIQSIPSRIGSNRMIDSAVDFFVNSYAAYWDDTYSNRNLARSSKAKALRELQLVVSNAQDGATYDILLATKMQYAAEALMGIDTMYHAIHAFGLAELLKSGSVSNVDDEHYWNLIDNTYVDDVNEAMLVGRNSVYDNEFYLSTTYPPPLNTDSLSISASQRASMAIMHVFIQCPRSVSLIRHAISNPEDTSALAAAVSHMESLIQIDLSQHMFELTKTAISVVPMPPSLEMADIMPDSLEFDSVQNMVLCTRYWMLQNILCGLADTLHRHFPAETAWSLLPSPERIRVIDVDSALHVAKSLRWANSIPQRLPLVPLRLHTPLQISIGPWYRTIRCITTISNSDQTLDAGMISELSRAERMKAWLFEQCNHVHKEWDVSFIDEKPLVEALDSMAGEKKPDWLPVRIRFEAEDGEMVMKLDYENRTGNYSERYDLGEHYPRRSPNSLGQSQEWQRETLRVQELPFRDTASNSVSPLQSLTFDNANKNACLAPSFSTRPVDFLHSTGRNLCSTSGWWPDTSNTSKVLLESTSQVSAFSQTLPSTYTDSELTFGDMDSHPCLASSWWPQRPNASTASSVDTPTTIHMSSNSSGAATFTFDNEKKNACFSPAWSSKS
ncbi:hypothetical protein EJ02DRAFT_456309 [Clathrospora elynae]|uniref:Zn(2)-C6 fungal-type domain-containing protein n=1 Tax=Clathrospora elynae TaxID=706981 RepID=A0A6A5SJ30_9PLEO|nr:hypothetical protein EJ02DRAFT_456309 [Clathrospora elynae]